MKATQLLTALALLVSLGLWSCSAPSVTLMPRVAQMSASGNLGASDTSSGSPVVASSDTDALGLDDAETSFAPRAQLRWGALALDVEHLELSYSGSGQAQAEFELGGVTIAQNAEVDSNFDLGLSSATLTWDLVPGDTFELGLGLGVMVADLQADITGTNPATATASTDELVPLPVLAARVGGRFGRFSVEGLARGLDLTIDNVDARMLDLDLHARYDFFGQADSRLHAGLVLGWRDLSIDASYDDGGSQITADLEFSGPYAGIGLTF